MSDVTKAFRVVKGSRHYTVEKGLAFTATVSAVVDYGVRLYGEHIGTWWFAGNRTQVPEMKIGQRFNLHRGNPTRYITIEVL